MSQARMRLTVFLSLFVWLLAGCGIPKTSDDFNKTPEAQFLRGVVDKLAARDFASVEQLLDPQPAGTDIRGALEEIAAALPKGSVLAGQPVAWQVFQGGVGPRTATLAAEYSY